jgi:hypothetical protein
LPNFLSAQSNPNPPNSSRVIDAQIESDVVDLGEGAALPADRSVAEDAEAVQPTPASQDSNRRGRKRGRKSKAANRTDDQQHQDGEPATATAPSSSATFRPISDWRKVFKYPPNYSDLSTKLVEQQVFKNPLPPYVPCVPKNTSQGLIDYLTDRDVEQLSCPGCKDRFLLPSSFFQHLYRKSVRIQVPILLNSFSSNLRIKLSKRCYKNWIF